VYTVVHISSITCQLESTAVNLYKCELLTISVVDCNNYRQWIPSDGSH